MKNEKEFLSIVELVAKSIQGTGLKYRLWFDFTFVSETRAVCTAKYIIPGSGKLPANLMNILHPRYKNNPPCNIEATESTHVVRQIKSIFQKYGVEEEEETINIKRTCNYANHIVYNIKKSLFKPPAIGGQFVLNNSIRGLECYSAPIKELIDESTFVTEFGVVCKYWIVDEV